MNDSSPNVINGYRHNIGSHCESGTFRNLLLHAGFDISEPMAFGIGSGIAFFYVFFARGPSGLPLVALRLPPGAIFKNGARRLGLDIIRKQHTSADQAIAHANRLIEAGTPVVATLDMFYMKYLPPFIQVHAPFHFVLLVGREGDHYLVSDPYYNGIGRLHIEDLRAAWETHAPMAKDNCLYYMNGTSPDGSKLKPAIRQGIKKTCGTMILPPVFNRMFSFVGVQGMRTFAKKMTTWPDTYRGVRLREGILFNAVTFEDQGTGGGAFRLLYGSFLQEVSEIFTTDEISALANRIIEHGNNWKNVSRKLIRLGKTVPMDDDAYPDWYREHGDDLRAGLREVAADFREFADVETAFFRDLRTAVANLS